MTYSFSSKIEAKRDINGPARKLLAIRGTTIFDVGKIFFTDPKESRGWIVDAGFFESLGADEIGRWLEVESKHVNIFYYREFDADTKEVTIWHIGRPTDQLHINEIIRIAESDFPELGKAFEMKQVIDPESRHAHSFGLRFKTGRQTAPPGYKII